MGHETRACKSQREMHGAPCVAAPFTSPTAAPPTCRQWAGLLPQLSVKLRRILVPLTTSVEVSLNGRLIAVGEDASVADFEDASAEEAVGGVTLLRRRCGKTHTAASVANRSIRLITLAQRFLSSKAAREIKCSLKTSSPCWTPKN
jgi:hypothetical protein